MFKALLSKLTQLWPDQIMLFSSNRTHTEVAVTKLHLINCENKYISLLNINNNT